MEVNLCPSLATESPLDQFIKTNLLLDTLNLIGIKTHNRYTTSRTRQRFNSSPPRRAEQLSSEIFMETMDEFTRRGSFIRVFPSKSTKCYTDLFRTPRTNNKQLYKLLYNESHVSHVRQTAPEESKQKHEDLRSSMRKISNQKLPSQRRTERNPNKPAPAPPREDYIKPSTPQKANSFSDILPSKTSTPTPAPPSSKKKDQKIVITGDDVLIEYISRLMHATKAIREDSLKLSWKRALDKFVSHHVWMNTDLRKYDSTKLWKRIELRLHEMKERRRRLCQSIYRRRTQGTSQDNEDYREEQKQILLRGFSAL